MKGNPRINGYVATTTTSCRTSTAKSGAASSKPVSHLFTNNKIGLGKNSSPKTHPQKQQLPFAVGSPTITVSCPPTDMPNGLAHFAVHKRSGGARAGDESVFPNPAVGTAAVTISTVSIPKSRDHALVAARGVAIKSEPATTRDGCSAGAAKSRQNSRIGTVNSITGNNSKPKNVKPSPIKKRVIRSTYHETLQRIECPLVEFNHYQQHWFSSGLERLKVDEMSRDERLEITRYELHRHLNQLIRSQVGTEFPSKTANSTSTSNSANKARARSSPGQVKVEPDVNLCRKTTSSRSRIAWPPAAPPNSKETLPTEGAVPANASSCGVSVKHEDDSSPQRRWHVTDAALSVCCVHEQCSRPALPCARHCHAHIAHNSDQVIFRTCTAKFADNTQCSVPVFDIQHEMPLCQEHARKRDNYKQSQQAKPKKIRKRVKPSAMIRPQKRSKRKKTKQSPCQSPVKSSTQNATTLVTPQHQPLITENHLAMEADFEHVLTLPEEPADLVELSHVVNASLASQVSSHLLEESDLTNVLGTIHSDEFNDLLFSTAEPTREPTREETEELERALAQVDHDVKSLESFLVDHTMDDDSLHIPDVFQHHHHHHNNGASTFNIAGCIPAAVGSPTQGSAVTANRGANARLLSVLQLP